MKVRLLGSTNHVISTYKSAVSAVHLLLVPILFVTTTGKGNAPLKFAAQSARLGQEYVDAVAVPRLGDPCSRRRRPFEQVRNSLSEFRCSGSNELVVLGETLSTFIHFADIE